MKQLFFIFTVALASCGTTGEFAQSYQSAGSPYGSIASVTQPSPYMVTTRAKAIGSNSGTVIVNPGSSTGGSACPGSMGSSPVKRPQSSINQNSVVNGKALINQIGNQVRRTSSPTQRQIVRRF